MAKLPTRKLSIGGTLYQCLDLPGIFGPEFSRLPYQLRILLENSLRNAPGERHAEICKWFRSWLAGDFNLPDLEFRPGRVLMHDTTCIPALVDIAAMRDAAAERGLDPELLSPSIRVDVSVDHSTPVEFFASKDAFKKNLDIELARNAERYRMMKWASSSLKNFYVFPPGSGIMHTINLEQLATVIGDKEGWLVPDTLVGTDSHTPMINGIGVFGWGVGGLEAETVMFGLPVMMRFPDVVGVRLDGRLREGSLSTDLVLSLTALLRRHDVTGKLVEFFGPGVSSLTGSQRATIANMAAEFGATTAYFPIDSYTLEYLRMTGRTEDHVERVGMGARALGIWFDPVTEPKYSETVRVDLGAIEPSLAGPRRPHDRVSSAGVASSLESLFDRKLGLNGSAIPDGAVAIAAITSCTNTSDPELLITAGLLAQKANKLGLRPPAWVKTSLAPGSPSAAMYLKRADVADDLDALGFNIVGYGCTTCIGNSGALVPEMSRHIRDGGISACVLSGNRNFPGRVHPEVNAGFLCSPPLVVAFALAGHMNLDIWKDPIATTEDGTAVRLIDIWPDADEIEAVCHRALIPNDVVTAFDKAQKNAAWTKIEGVATAHFPWDASSTYLQAPPFARQPSGYRIGSFDASPILVLGDDITTDHISPAGRIDLDGDAGRFLVEHGEDPQNLNVFASRRGNWHVMTRGLFSNATVVNLLGADIPPGQTVVSGEHSPMMLCDAAKHYRDADRAVVIVGGHRFGQGSSRDWAAKGIAMLGTRAVLACSFERIHRSNLIGMGVLPIVLPERAHPETLGLTPDDLVQIRVDPASLSPCVPVSVSIIKKNGQSRNIECQAAVQTDLEVETLRHGGTIPLILASIGGRAKERRA